MAGCCDGRAASCRRDTQDESPFARPAGRRSLAAVLGSSQAFDQGSRDCREHLLGVPADPLRCDRNDAPVRFYRSRPDNGGGPTVHGKHHPAHVRVSPEHLLSRACRAGCRQFIRRNGLQQGNGNCSIGRAHRHDCYLCDCAPRRDHRAERDDQPRCFRSAAVAESGPPLGVLLVLHCRAGRNRPVAGRQPFHGP